MMDLDFPLMDWLGDYDHYDEDDEDYELVTEAGIRGERRGVTRHGRRLLSEKRRNNELDPIFRVLLFYGGGYAR